MNPPQVYLCSPSWTLLPPPSPYPPSGSSQCTSPKHPVSCIEPGLATCFIHDILHVSMPFSQKCTTTFTKNVKRQIFKNSSSVLGLIPKVQAMKEKISKSNLFKIKNFCEAEDINLIKSKHSSPNGRKYLQTIYLMRFISRIYKEILYLNN